MIERLRRWFRITRDCPSCRGVLHPVTIRVEPGTGWQGPYYRCQSCATFFHSESKRLVATPTGAETLVLAVEAALPEIKQGSLVVFGDIFGGRIDNIHTVVGAEMSSDDCALVRFDQGETLRIWNPHGVRVNATEFRVERASRVRWEWHYYGRPPTPANLYFQEHRLADDHVEASSDVDWYVPVFAPTLDRPAVELVGFA